MTSKERATVRFSRNQRKVKQFGIFLMHTLLAIANWMSSQGVSYNGINTMWNKNMVKRILENEKYLGRNSYPAIIDEETFQEANMQKKIKTARFTEISEELKAIRSLTYCAECGHRLSRIGGAPADLVFLDPSIYALFIQIGLSGIYKPTHIDTKLAACTAGVQTALGVCIPK